MDKPHQPRWHSELGLNSPEMLVQELPAGHYELEIDYAGYQGFASCMICFVFFFCCCWDFEDGKKAHKERGVLFFFLSMLLLKFLFHFSELFYFKIPTHLTFYFLSFSSSSFFFQQMMMDGGGKMNLMLELIAPLLNLNLLLFPKMFSSRELLPTILVRK